MRKLFFLFLALVATTSLWAHDFEVDGIYYNFLKDKTNEVEVSFRGRYYNSYSEEYSGSLNIPASVTYEDKIYSVTKIGMRAFFGCDRLTSATIPNSVKVIGRAAFENCTTLTSINIPNSVTSIEYGAFYLCKALTSIDIPNSVKDIGEYAFYACWGLVSANIPNHITRIGEGMFCNCSSLTSITIPNTVTSIGNHAFANCYSLTSITIPNTVTSVGYCAFINCTGITSPIYNAHCFVYLPASYSGAYTIPDGIKQLAGGAFTKCSKLTSITIPNSITSIGDYAFQQCSSLTPIVIPNSVMSIGGYAFSDCSKLDSIIIPNGITNIENETFRNCTSLKSISIPNSVTFIGRDVFDNTAIYNDENNWEDGVLYVNNCLIEVKTSYSGACSVKEGTRPIAGNAFYGCSGLTSIVIPKSVTSIGYAAFYGCSRLISVTLGDSLTSIGDNAFFSCSSLTSFNVPNSVKDIGKSAFYGCSSLTSIAIPNSVTSIGSGAFSGCASITSLTVESGNAYYDSRNNCNAIIETATNTLIAGCQNTVIPNNITSIGSSALSGCSFLSEITIPNSVTSIGDNAFSSCYSLNSILIPDSVTTIGNYAFSNCSSLTSIICKPIEPPILGYNVFTNVPHSIPVYLPCGSEEAYKEDEQWSVFTNIHEPEPEFTVNLSTQDSLKGTAKVDFNHCGGTQISAGAKDGYHFSHWNDGNTDNPRALILTQDTTLTAEFALTTSGKCGDNLYWQYVDSKLLITGFGAMYNERPWGLLVNDINEVVLPADITHIGNDAFTDCAQLKAVTIPAAVTSIGTNTFAGCRYLRNINCYPPTPPHAHETSFANYNVNLNVPCDYKEDYQYDMVFGSFKYLNCLGAESDNTGSEDVTITPGTTDVTIVWPTKDNAYTYTIIIKKNDDVVCRLTFNMLGQLINISFAPGRNGNHPIQCAEQMYNAYRFTVTGLEEHTRYIYNVETKDEADNTINTYTGEFTTQPNISTNVSDIQSPIIDTFKLLRNGQLIILRDGVEYNAMGQEIQ